MMWTVLVVLAFVGFCLLVAGLLNAAHEDSDA